MGRRRAGRSRGRHAKARSRPGVGLWLALALGAVVLVGAIVAVWPASSPGGRPVGATGTPGRGAADAGLGEHAPTTTSIPLNADPVFHRVLVVGDSLGVDLGDQLSDHLEGIHAVTTSAAVGDTGLDDAAFYDWPAHLATMLATDHPTLVVVLLGANDDQGLYAGSGPVAPGTSAWDRAYAARVHEMLTEATGSGAEVAWVGMPPMSDPTLDHWMQHIDGIFERQTARFPDAVYVSSTAVLGTPSGGFEAAEPGVDGTALRTPDGVHLTAAGASLLASAVITAVVRRPH